MLVISPNADCCLLAAKYTEADFWLTKTDYTDHEICIPFSLVSTPCDSIFSQDIKACNELLHYFFIRRNVEPELKGWKWKNVL